MINGHGTHESMMHHGNYYHDNIGVIFTLNPYLCLLKSNDIQVSTSNEDHNHNSSNSTIKKKVKLMIFLRN